MSQNNTTTELVDLKRSIDDFFIMTNGIFISLMQGGFACLELGAVRTKNAVNILMKNLLDLVICGFAYYTVGYPLAYGEGNAFLGYTYWAGFTLPLDQYVNWFFQFIFAATSATIVSGAVAERCNFVAYLIYSAVISGIVYPIVTHWAWAPNGWLNTLGFHDFSGCGVVHALAGTCAFIAASFLGPRKGRFDENGKPRDMGGHSLPIMGIGALLLFTGFLAFNGGALSHITEKGDGIIVARSMINTIIAGSGGGLVTLILGRFRLLNEYPWPFSFILNGTLAGMASSCAAPHEYEGWGIFIIGIVGALLYLCLHRFVLFLKVDDPLDAVALHFAGGTWGMLAEGIFNHPNGLVYGANSSSGLRILFNMIGLLSIIAWSAVWSLALFGGLHYMGLLRVSEEEELKGLDVTEHGEEAYPRDAWGDNGFFWKVRNSESSPPPHVLGEKLYPSKSVEEISSKMEKDNPAFLIEPQYVWNI